MPTFEEKPLLGIITTSTDRAVAALVKRLLPTKEATRAWHQNIKNEPRSEAMRFVFDMLAYEPRLTLVVLTDDADAGFVKQVHQVLYERQLPYVWVGTPAVWRMIHGQPDGRRICGVLVAVEDDLLDLEVVPANAIRLGMLDTLHEDAIAQLSERINATLTN